MKRILQLIAQFDDESLNTILLFLWNTSRTAGGYRDKETWYLLRIELEKTPFIKQFMKEMEKAYEEADKIDIKVVKKDE